MTLEGISKEITAFIEQLSGVDSSDDIATNDALLSEQVVDSLGIIELVYHIEGKYNLRIDQDDLTVENFDSVKAISSYIVSKI